MFIKFLHSNRTIKALGNQQLYRNPEIGRTISFRQIS